MNRQIVYANELFLNTDFLNQVINQYVSNSKIIESVYGTSQQFSGLACVPATPPSLSVNINPGQFFQLEPVDTAQYGSLPADSHEIVKQAILLDPLTFSLTPPVSAGNEIKYLIQGTLESQDATPASRAFYNNSSTNGLPPIIQNVSSLRSDNCEIQLKAGVAAPTGTAVTPTPDDGFMGMWVITVQHGQTSITSGNITRYSGAKIAKSFADIESEISLINTEITNVENEITEINTDITSIQNKLQNFAFRSYANVNQSIPPNTATKVNFGAANFGTISASRFTATQSGIYQFNCGITFSPFTSANTIDLFIYKNGAEYSRVTTTADTASTTSTTSVNLSDLVNLSVGDYVEIYTAQGQTVARNLLSGTNLTYFSGYKIQG